ncbi:MAG: hypothetical protein IJ950_02165 [Helicobacter sp.]|nr:hypothetical protein [Helicobacter sp.]
MYPINLSEEELKNKVATDFFSPNPQSRGIKLDKQAKEILKDLDSTQILGRVDFCVSFNAQTLFQPINFLWAEAKKGNKADIIESFIQLILTIGKEKTYENNLPPIFLGAFDCQKIAFIPYHELDHIFAQNDFNWNVTPSNHDSKEFKQLHALTKHLLESKKLQFSFTNDCKELQDFIQANFTIHNTSITKIPITKNNFTTIYQKWLQSVAPSISIDWENEKPDILSSDFYLADLLSENNNTKEILKSLRILLQSDSYKVKLEKRANSTSFNFTEFGFNDHQKAHTEFWNLYERPPKEEYWGYIIERRDLLVPSDIRERKGAFFTPQIWVSKAHEYLEKALGENYQSEYYIWDCAAGTGNLLANLTESHKIYASTLDKADVEIMQELSSKKSLNVLSKHIFQCDFLNDEFFDKPCSKHTKSGLDPKCQDCVKSKLPKSLQEILKNEEKRKKLIIFINPPYAETATKRVNEENRKNKVGVSFTEIRLDYSDQIGIATKELFAQFMIRIYKEINGCILAQFSKLKIVQGPNFAKFRNVFKANFLGGFIAPADTFDNVKGQFPIGFTIWDTSNHKATNNIKTQIFNESATLIGNKIFYSYTEATFITDWYRQYHTRKVNDKNLGAIGLYGSDFQHNNFIRIVNPNQHPNRWTFITQNNLIPTSIYFSVRHCIKATWINDRDQFLYPNNKWEQDSVFQSDCLAFMLFHGQNRITSKVGINHFIPFSEKEIGAHEAFESHFMRDFLQGKIKHDCETNKDSKQSLFGDDDIAFIPTKPLTFSHEAQEVLNAGKELFRHYHTQSKEDKDYNPNVSLYDIKAHFQGFNDKGKMNPPQKADDEVYKQKLGELNYALKVLAKKIEVKVYEYEFLLP